MKAAAIMNYWRAAAFLASLGSDGPGSGSGVAEPAVPDTVAASLSSEYCLYFGQLSGRAPISSSL